MDLTEGSETSAKPNLTPGENPEENTQGKSFLQLHLHQIDLECHQV
jgi:hypothetical protein